MRQQGLPCRAVLGLFLCGALPAYAAESTATGSVRGPSGQPLPRFAALRTDEANLRTGPGTRYPIEWVMVRKGLPLEITAEYEVWRRVRDSEGVEGWLHKSALSGKRMGIITGKRQPLRGKDTAQGPVLAWLTPGVTGQLVSCAPQWCEFKVNGIKGYLPKTAFWGAYPGETFD